jgi:hypothetical protein
MTTATELKAFEVGRTYSCRSICDYDCVWTYTIVARTAKTITTACGKTFRIISKLSEATGVEKVFPQGRFSMCPVLSADK